MTSDNISIFLSTFCLRFTIILKCYISALLITGGYNFPEFTISSVEVWRPDTSTTCSLPPLPKRTQIQAQTSLTTCGGYSAQFCYTFTNGEWTKSHRLREYKGYRTTGEIDGKTYLIAGNGTEILSDSGTTTPGFTLIYLAKILNM